MNKFLCNLFFVFFCSTMVSPLVAEMQSKVEIRSAAFFPNSKRFRAIYGNVGPNYQIEASTKLCNYLDGWTNLDWFSKHGHSEGFNDPTRISIVNLGFGGKFFYQFCEQITAYTGIGPSFGGVFLKNKLECCGHKHISRFAFGGLVKTGVYCSFNKRVFMDLFFDYLYQPVHFKTYINVGGIKTGIGVGAKF